jgi:dipeptide/tripeptide permease
MHHRACLAAGSYQSLSWGVSAIGGILSAYLSGFLIQKYGVSFVFGLTALFPLMTLGSALLLQEQRIVRRPAISPGNKGDSAAITPTRLSQQVRDHACWSICTSSTPAMHACRTCCCTCMLYLLLVVRQPCDSLDSDL